MKCLIVQPIHNEGLRLLRAAGIEPVLAADPDMDHIARVIPGCHAAITRDAGLDGRAIAAGDCLRAIVIHGTGHDAVDKIAAHRKGVLVCNTPGANARSVSELALGLALSAARLISAADRAVQAGEAGFREAHVFHELSGKTALIVGWGATGAGLGRMLDSAFGMRVLAYSPRNADTGPFERVERLEEALAQADLVSLHTPLRDQTRNLFGAKAFAALKKGAVFVNTSRAGLVDEAALAAALGNGTVAAAGLDVYSPEAPHGALAATGRVIFTPHLGGATVEALERVAVGAARNVITALSGRRPETTIDINPEPSS